MKRKTRTKEIDYAIKYLYENQKMSSTQIALELGIEEAIVESTINQPATAKPNKPSRKQNLMINQTVGKKVNNVSIMTEAASQHHDEFVKNIPSTNSRMSSNSIHRPNG